MNVFAGSNFGHYEIISLLGAGGMGEVWLAEDTRLKRKVALKLLPADLTADAERVRRFEQEAQAASALSHPNIITIHDIGECDAGRFIVMEMVAGRTLREVIAKNISLETVLALGQQMARALSAAHAAGITHRDIKPDNIMVRDDGYLKVLDFGLARLRPATESDAETATLALQTTPGAMMGTVAYMSPEQARGETVSNPSDIFALGIVLYELATGRHPFKADTLVGYLHAITLQTPPPLTQLKPELPAALDALISRMLSKDASLRPTANEVAQALQNIERQGDSGRLPSSEGETMVLPGARVSIPRADKGFWVAVLPFKWRGANVELEALAEGLSEDIVTGLSRFSYLRVIARSSTLRCTSETSDVRAIGKELGARYVMEGSLRQAGSMLRVAVQLVDAGTGAHLWAETYDRQFRSEDIFALQDDLVPRIVSTVADLHGVLPRSLSEAVSLKPRDQLSTYEAVLRSFIYTKRATPDALADALAVLELAVQKAPMYADAWALMAYYYTQDYGQGFNLHANSLVLGTAAARKAVEAAPSNHLAWFGLAQALFFQKEWQGFRNAAERAAALNPMDGNSLAFLGEMFLYAGDVERGLALVDRAKQLNPHHPGWYWYANFYNAYRQRDYRGALDFVRKVNLPGHWAEHAFIAAACGQLGEREAAAKAVQDLLKIRPDFAATVRTEIEKWWQAEYLEHWIDGLRKAGLAIDDSAQAASVPIVTIASEVDASPLATSDAQLIPSPTQSIAVLPFANISADDENEYFCDGLAEELLNALSKIDELKVAARTSAFSFKGKNAEAREIGKTLNVNTVLEGSVRKSGNRLRINVQLVNAAEGYQLWSERYDREMKDIFDVQDEITLAVVDALKVKLLGAKKAAVLKRHTRNAEAHEHYLRGLFYFNRFTPSDFQKAIECFNRAIAIDSHYASAYAGLANAYVEMAFFTFSAPGEWIAKAQEAVNAALALDETLGEAHNSLAIIRMYYDRDYPGAERAFKQALALDPGSAHIPMWYAWYLGLMGRFAESFPAYQRALELDPLSEMINTSVGIVSYWAGQSERAITQLQKVLELNPHYSLAQIFLAEVYTQRGDFGAAAALVANLQQSANDPLTLPTVGYVYGKIGAHQSAQEILTALAQRATHEFVSALNFAQIYAGFGDTDQTLAWLEQACDESPIWLTFVKVDPKFDFLRSDPRFQNLLQRIGFPPDPQTDELPEPGVDDKRTENLLPTSGRFRHTVGRETERNELRTAFNAAKGGRGSLLCIAGEPGIGKTTLVEDFLTELTTANSCTIARGRCSERLAGTEAYLPLLEALESLLAADVEQVANLLHREKLKQLAPTWYAQVVPLAGDSEESARLLAEVKAASQERMKRELANFLQAVAEAQPLVIFFDDLHWADVSTIDLLSFIAGKFEALRVLIVVTYRPSDMLLSKHPFLQIKPDLQARGYCRELSLEFLTEAEIADYLTLEFPRHAFPPDFAKLIHAKTEGSPLFMADLVRYLRDRSVIAAEGSTQDACVPRLVQTLPDIERELPESVRGMIERKIAQLSEDDRKLLTCASVQGYEFDSAVVAQVLQLDPDEIEERLEKLERVFAFVKLVSEVEFPNRTLALRYRFVHVLYQNALYGGLRVTRKATLSAAVAQSLLGFYDSQSHSIAGELAKLFETARGFAQAAEYFAIAAQQAAQVSANTEAIALSRRGLDALQTLPATAERDRQELRLQLALGTSLAATTSWASPEVGSAYRRAEELCQREAGNPQYFQILSGLWSHYVVRAEMKQTSTTARQLLSIAQAAQEPAMLELAHAVTIATLHHLGEFAAAEERFEACLCYYRPDSVVSSHYSNYYLATGEWARVLWFLGYPDRALRQAQEGADIAASKANPFHTCFALQFLAFVHSLRREAALCQEIAESVFAISKEHDTADSLLWASIAHGWAIALQGRHDEGVSELRRSIAAYTAAGAEIGIPQFHSLMAEAMRRAGRIEEALGTVEEALTLANSNGDAYFNAELQRLRGEMLLQTGAIEAEAEACFKSAIEVAKQQSAKSWELRATISLARLQRRQGKITEARQMLAEIYGWFREGFDTADLQEAKALLDDLGSEFTS